MSGNMQQGWIRQADAGTVGPFIMKADNDPGRHSRSRLSRSLVTSSSFALNRTS